MSKLAERKLAWGFGLSLIVLAANALISYRDLAELVANTGKAVHSRDILEGIEDVALAFKDAETARRGVLIDGNLADFAEFEVSAATLKDELSTLVDLAKDRPDQHQACLLLQKTALARLEELRGTLDRVKAGRLEEARAEFSSEPIRARLRSVCELTQEIEDREVKYQKERVAERRASIYRAFITFSIASTLALMLIGSIYAPRPPLPGRTVEGRPDPPRERGPRPTPARLGRRGGLRRRLPGDLHLLQPRRARAPRLRVGRPGSRPEHARPDPPYA